MLGGDDSAVSDEFDAANTTARSDPTASITATASSTHAWRVSPSKVDGASERPTPPISNRMTRAQVARRSVYRRQWGSSAASSIEM